MIFDIWHDTVIAGKGTDKFATFAARRRRTATRLSKYDVTVVDDSGSISLDDAQFLADIVQKYKPRIIVEIGTWFGTSAYVMAFAQMVAGVEGTIFTCDKKDLFVPKMTTREGRELRGVEFFNGKSTKLLKSLWERRTKIDMAFIDGSIDDKDWNLLLKLFGDNPVLVATHDIDRLKGKNVKKLFLHSIAKCEVMIKPDSTIWCGRQVAGFKQKKIIK